MCVKCKFSSSNYFRDLTRGPKFTLARDAPHAQQRIFSFPKKYNCPSLKMCKFSTFEIPALYEILRGSQIYSKGRCAPRTPRSGKVFNFKKST